MWLQFGYKYSEESLETTEFADKMDEKRILNADFHKMSRSESRIVIMILVFRAAENAAIKCFVKTAEGI